ncbi:4237_t:CDS:1, partial [Gigaspora margarita]
QHNQKIVSMNITCLKTLALNILKNGSSETIASGVEVPELDPCSICNEEIFLHILKKPFTVLTCGHTVHRLCLENLRETMFTCPVNNCSAEIEIIEKSPLMRAPSQRSMSIDEGSQDPVVISTDSLDNNPSHLNTIAEENLNDNSSQNKESGIPKRVSRTTSNDKPPNKKVKKAGDKKANEKKESQLLNKLIDELIGDHSESSETSSIIISTSTSQMDMTKLETLIHLYQNISNAESNNDKTSHEVLRSYYTFGLWISKRYEFHRKSNPDHTAQVRVNDDIKEQLIEKVTETTLWKRTERARKIYAIFSEAGEDKIKLVKSATANTISKLPWSSVDYIVINISKKKQSAS